MKPTFQQDSPRSLLTSIAVWSLVAVAVIGLLALLGSQVEPSANAPPMARPAAQPQVQPAVASTPAVQKERDLDAIGREIDREIEEGRKRYGDLDRIQLPRYRSPEEVKAQAVCAEHLRRVGNLRQADLTVNDLRLLTACQAFEP